MILPSNSETAFVVVQRRNVGDKVPKLCKIMGEIHFDPDEAFSECDKANKTFDPSGKHENQCYAVAEIEVSFTQQFKDKAEFDEAEGES